jgi:hypothetical protein
MLNVIWGLGVVSTTPYGLYGGGSATPKAFGGGLANPRPKPKPSFPFCFLAFGGRRIPPKADLGWSNHPKSA